MLPGSSMSTGNSCDAVWEHVALSVPPSPIGAGGRRRWKMSSRPATTIPYSSRWASPMGHGSLRALLPQPYSMIMSSLSGQAGSGGIVVSP